MLKELSDNNELNIFLNKNDISIPINNPFSKNVVYIENGEIIGFLNYSIMYEKAEINNIMVEKEYRGRHIATKMMEYVVEKCKICDNITLEVRKSNEVAINLYRRFNFKEVAIRQKYYDNEDGILMMRDGD